VLVLKLGYKASAEQFGPNELLAFSSLAETLGFDSVFVSDHFQPWKHNGGHAPFSFAWLGALGARTRRILIGTSVVTPTFRYHPAVVAQAMATLGVLFSERVILGVGTGESLNEVPAVGIKWPGFKERQSRLRESILLMRRLWTEERVSFDGTYYRTDKATIYDRPSRPVPIYVAASGPSAATLAGELADGFICTSGKGMELYRDTLLPAVATGLRASARDEDGIERMIELKVSFGDDLQQCREDTRHWAALALSSEEKTGVTDPLELERLAAALPLERAASRWIISTDPDEHVEKIGAYVALGFRHLVFHAPGLDQERFLRTYAKEILPRLRHRFD
jgi:coenzyme F420-dependent glucose-6-phosphate dehydrogenase